MSFINNIRQSDNRTKLRYVILFSGIIGIFVVAAWAFSVRGILEKISTPGELKQESASLTAKVGGAWKGIKERTGNTVDFIKEKAGATNEIIINKE